MDIRTLMDDFFDAVERVATERGLPTMVEVLDMARDGVAMTTHKIQSLRSLREEMKAVARGERPAPPDAARMSFDSVEALARRPRARSSEPGRYAMARHQTLKRSLTWGATVKVSEAAPARFRPGELGAVCGVRAIETTAAADEFNQPLGTTLYLVEFAGGEAIEVPESFLSTA